MCRVKILSGKVFQPAGTPVRKSDTRFGYVHSCVSYPLEDLEIMLLIEEGLMDELNWDLIDFDRSANRIVSVGHTNRTDGNAWAIYITIIAFVLLGLQLIPSKKKDPRA